MATIEEIKTENGFGMTHVECSVCHDHFVAVTLGMTDDKIIEKLLNLGWCFGKDDSVCKECIDKMKEGAKDGC